MWHQFVLFHPLTSFEVKTPTIFEIFLNQKIITRSLNNYAKLSHEPKKRPDRYRKISNAPQQPVGVINPDWHHVNASSLVNSVFRASPSVRSPTVRCRVMNLISGVAHTARRQDGFKTFKSTRPQRPFWNCTHGRIFLHNSNLEIGC